jgi:omega-6 fatty acid desaturase (delta-12 desaturase)
MQTENERGLLKRIARFSTPDNKTALFELSVTLLVFLVLSGLMIYSLTHGYWLTFAGLPLAAVLITRLFTIQHDCGHGSYFSSQKVNNAVGCFLGVLTLTPYYYWRKNHSIHHAFSGNLDKRGVGDVDTITVEEYRTASFFKKLWYRIYRNPVFMIVVAPPLLFGLKHRLPVDCEFHSVKLWANIMLTNAAIAGAIALLVHFFGAQSFFLVYLPVIWGGSALGVAMFYIQHQYEDAYWNRKDEWSYFDAGLQGSSYFEFSKVFSWLVGNINLHHIHHLNGHIPSYRLRECLTQIPELQTVAKKRTLTDIPACFRLALWDDKAKKMVGFGA